VSLKWSPAGKPGRRESNQPCPSLWRHAPAGDHYYWTTSIFDVLDDALIDALVPNAATPPDPLCEVQVHDLGGAVAVMPADATAFVHRDAPFFIDTMGHTMGHAQAAGKFTEIREWARALRSSLAPWARDGVQANFAGEASDWHVRTHDAATRAPGELAPEVRPGRVAAARTQRLGGEFGQ
jgi:hypothetical protein